MYDHKLDSEVYINLHPSLFKKYLWNLSKNKNKIKSMNFESLLKNGNLENIKTQ